MEKSSDYRSYSAIGSVPSKGNGTNTYHFTEGNVLNGTAYYRIRQTDVNGRSSLSPVLRLNNNLDNSTSIYPNPVKV